MASRTVTVETKKNRKGRKKTETSYLSIPESKYTGNRKGIRLDANKELERVTKRQLEEA